MGRNRIPTPLNSASGSTVLGTVEISNDVGSPIPVSGTITAGAQFAEDVAATSGDLGTVALVVRKDAEGSNVSADGDYASLLVDANGRLKVVLASSKAEDSMSADGDIGLFVLAMRHDAETATVTTDGDYAALQLDSLGRLRIVTTPAQGTLTDRSGTIAAGGTAQVAMAASPNRKYVLLVNPLLAAEQGIGTAEDLWFNFTGTATAGSPSIKLGSGESFVMEAGFVTTQALSVVAATTGHKWTLREGA